MVSRQVQDRSRPEDPVRIATINSRRVYPIESLPHFLVYAAFVQDLTLLQNAARRLPAERPIHGAA